ncbi:MAG: leucine-rich repeat domain-containing protein [Clostridia bacterium]|nr:leucine-rich repeat domain-containing protein [Clostridia bacterium]
MKKKILLVASMVILLVCLLAICVSAETVLKPQDNNNYGELSFFDEPIGRTNTYGTGTLGNYSPYMEDGETYARVVIGDGTTFYTFPTQYVTRNNAYDWEKKNGISIFELDLSYLNSAMETATSKNPGWTKENIYRIEMPYNTLKFNGGTQSFSGYSKVIEIFLQPNSGSLDQSKGSMFWRCYELETIHNLDTFVFRKGCLGGAFQDCGKLTTLTIGYSPEVVHTDNSTFVNCTSLTSVNFVEAFPNIVEIGQNVFQNCYALTTINPTDQAYTFKLQSGITYINHNAFQNCDSVKAIKFSGSYVQLRQNVLNSLDNLEYIYFPKNSELKISDCEVFSSNPKLKAFALPDNCVSLPDRGFKNCPLLEAVYLPANVQTFVCNGWDQAPFSSNAMLYFVNDWFNVLDENGDFLFESFDMPERPDVYYFPETLSALCTNKTSGTIFLNCYNINPYLVFGTKVTQITVNDGLLINCGTKGETKTAIFLGDMTLVCHSSQDSRLNNIQYVFANPNDKSVADVTITSNNSKVPADSSKIFFCATNTSYKMIGSGGTYGDDLGGAHFTSPRATKVTEADCVNPEGSTFYCFCGVKTGEEITAPALGHFAETIDEIVYNGANKFFEVGDIVYYCERCEETHTEVGAGKASPIFATLGLSAKQVNGNAIMQSFKIDRAAMELYNSNSEYDIVGYGLVAGTTLALGENAEIFDNTGAVTSTKAGVVNISERTEKYDIFEMKVQGLFGEVESQSGKIDLSKIDVYCCGYCLVQIGGNVVSYYASEGVVTETLSGAVSYETLSSKAQG